MLLPSILVVQVEQFSRACVCESEHNFWSYWLLSSDSLSWPYLWPVEGQVVGQSSQLQDEICSFIVMFACNKVTYIVDPN